MLHGYRLLGSIVLMGTLAMPVAVCVRVVAQEQERHDPDRDQGQQRDADRDKDHDRDQDRDHARIYDKDHRDYHQWNSGEDKYYRHWLAENRWQYQEFNQLSADQQRAYWQWRHEHPDER